MPMTRIEPSSERGVAMIVVLMVLIAATMLGTVALSAAGADMPFARDSQDRKQAYAAAEAGVEYYLYQLSQDNDYWTKCANGAAPNPGEPSPVDQRWIGAGADPRTVAQGPRRQGRVHHRADARTRRDNTCVISDDGKSMLDRGLGHVPGPRDRPDQRGRTRSIVATLRRKSFLDYLYFTELRDARPRRLRHADRCATGRRTTASRCATTARTTATDITFRSDDAINGPFHTNDDILTCGGTTLGRTKADAIEISGPHAPGWKNKSGCSGSPNMKGTLQSGAEPLEIPPTSTNTQLAAAAVAPYKFTGATTSSSTAPR